MLCLGWMVFVAICLNIASGFNAPPDVPTWCGKPYQNTDGPLEPGGKFQFPTPQSEPLLYVTLQPRYSIFLDSDESGSFIVGASISYLFGRTFINSTYGSAENNNSGTPFTALDISIFNEESGILLVSESIPVNSTANLLNFELSSFSPRLKAYSITLYGTTPDEQQTFTATTSIYVLPSRNFGSAVKIDNLYGGLYVQNAFNNWHGWYSVFPNGPYADGSVVTPSPVSLDNLNTYPSIGYNTINVVPDGGLPGQTYPAEEFTTYWDRMDELNLFNIFNMRFAFRNSTRIKDQVEMYKDRTTLLMWYTADEPDGWVYALNSTKLAYDQLREIDPYHPVSLVLNCKDFYYEEYTSGADIVFEDAYPVGANVTYSRPWGIPCNSTYGDCGCDDCLGGLIDVAMRLDDLQKYQENLEGQGMKPMWAVVQAFGGQEYWDRPPSVYEVEVMMMLSINHNAKGLTYWIYPSSDNLNFQSGKLGELFKSEIIMEFVFGSNAMKGLQVEGTKSIDASAWIVGDKMMVGIVNTQYSDLNGTITIALPSIPFSIDNILFGDSGWILKESKLEKKGIKGLEVDILILSLFSTPLNITFPPFHLHYHIISRASRSFIQNLTPVSVSRRSIRSSVASLLSVSAATTIIAYVTKPNRVFQGNAS
ncbi:hypothetical protein B7494_g3413 [Chlorociboria aeruginascens]|nr:hypothetical protein B7494_g3413 [Chlorociboria aeruginascens]